MQNQEERRSKRIRSKWIKTHSERTAWLRAQIQLHLFYSALFSSGCFLFVLSSSGFKAARRLGLQWWLSRTEKGVGFYPTCKLASQPATVFTDAGRRHETPGSETKDFITKSTERSICTRIFVSVLLPQHPKGAMWTGPDGCLKALWFHYRRGTLSLGNLNLFEWAVSRPALYSGERHYLSRPLYQHP